MRLQSDSTVKVNFFHLIFRLLSVQLFGYVAVYLYYLGEVKPLKYANQSGLSVRNSSNFDENCQSWLNLVHVFEPNIHYICWKMGVTDALHSCLLG